MSDILGSAGPASALALVAVALTSMVAYALLGRRPDADASAKGSQFLLGAGDFLVHWMMWVISPVESAALRLGLTPDAFNFLGLALGAASGLAIAAGQPELGGWAIMAGGICDILDGRLARRLGVASPYGQFIDSTFDRFVEVFVFLGFVYYLREHTWGPLVAAAAICGSLLVSYARARGESVGVLCKEGLMQRAERLVLTLLACLFDRAVSAWLGEPHGTVVVWVLALIAAGTFWTAAYRTLWIARRLRSPGGD
jgi:CDP-diacylglycerol--glycerol-3-phosphate 3-phosphatidyltransferase